MPNVEGGYVNPYYQEVEDYVVNELNARGTIYGARIRSSRKGANNFPTELAWAYQKIAYVRVTPIGGGTQLGGAHSRIMSNRKGELTLYDSTRNQPKYPLLQSLEISNEGTIGSLLKGKFSFVVYPDLYKNGFRMEDLEDSYFKPGKEVKIEWGWSVIANNGFANKGTMQGIIYNFDWQVNPDLSITANCSIVSKATIAIGLSGEQTNPVQDEETVKDPLGNPVPDSDLAGIIEADIADLYDTDKGTSLSLGQKVYIDKSMTKSGKKFNPYGLGYYAIAMPRSKQDAEASAEIRNQRLEKEEEKKSKSRNIFERTAIGARDAWEWTEQAAEDTGEWTAQAAKDTWNWVVGDSSPESDNPEPNTPPPPIVEPIYYIPLKDITQLINGLMQSGASKTGVTPIFEIKCDGNKTEHYENSIVSCSPERVFFPDDRMGNYGDWAPFKSKSELTLDADGNPFMGANNRRLVNIGNILISTNLIIEVYRKFVKDNQTNIAYKNITTFINDLITEVNFASGEVYQLSARLIEPEMLVSADGKKAGKTGGTAILSIEDTNLCSDVVDEVRPYWLRSDIIKPLIKNISITSKPPGPMATAAYAEARGKAGPQQTDVRTAKDSDIDTTEFDREAKEAKDAFDKLKFAFTKTGTGDKFSTDMKGAFAKFKRASRGSNSGVAKGAHWLNRALYPVDLSLTIDGINGFKFGDVIKTNLIPATYNDKDSDMVFVVTKITHTVKDGVWETKLDTKSRINMGEAKPGRPAKG